jgi:hypothetical protein
MKSEPHAEHAWLQRLVGNWTIEMRCSMGPDQPEMTSQGTESVRSIGGLWTLGEGKSEGPDGSPMTSFMTLGYDPKKGKFVGTFIASMMTHLWVYEGTLNAAKTMLTLDTEGPDFSGGEGMVAYQDIIEFHNDDHRELRSQLRDKDGKWQPFMWANYRRVK